MECCLGQNTRQSNHEKTTAQDETALTGIGWIAEAGISGEPGVEQASAHWKVVG